MFSLLCNCIEHKHISSSRITQSPNFLLCVGDFGIVYKVRRRTDGHLFAVKKALFQFRSMKDRCDPRCVPARARCSHLIGICNLFVSVCFCTGNAL